MNKLIRTRQGAVAYAAAPILVFALLGVMLLFGRSSPFSASLLADYQPVFLLLTVWMAFALPAMGVLARWLFLRMTGRRRLSGWTLLLMLPAALLMWFPAALLCLPLYLLNLLRLIRRRYPDGPPIRWQPILLLAAVLVGLSAASSLWESYRLSQPMPTAAEAFQRVAPDAQILAELPQGEDAVLIISQSASGVFARDERGWTLRTPYQSTRGEVSGATAAACIICRNPEAGDDVVCITAMSPGDPPQPRDTLGSEFILQATPLGPNTLCIWYAVVDVDVPGYAVTLE